MADNKLELAKGKIAELGELQETNDKVWFYRFLKLEDGTSGEHWSKTKATIEAHQTLFDSGTEVEFSWKKGAEGKQDKLTVYAPKGANNKDSGKRPSEYAKAAKEKDTYWADKFEWEKERSSRNDKKIELQHYQNLLQPFYLAAVEGGALELGVAIDAMDAKAIELYNRHNPNTPAAVAK